MSSEQVVVAMLILFPFWQEYIVWRAMGGALLPSSSYSFIAMLPYSCANVLNRDGVMATAGTTFARD